MRLDRFGNLGIWGMGITGSATGNIGAPTAKLDLKLWQAENTTVRILRVQNNNDDEKFLLQTVSGDITLDIKNSSNTSKVFLNSNGDSYFNGGDVGIGTDSPSGLLHIKSGSVNVFHADGTCGNVGIKLSDADITSIPEAAFTVKGNMSYAYVNYAQVAFTYTNVIDFNGFPAGVYQLNLCTQSDASSYGVFTVKWSGSAGTVINTLVSGGTNGGYGLSFSSTVLRSISNVNTDTAANLQCLVTYETCTP